MKIFKETILFMAAIAPSLSYANANANGKDDATLANLSAYSESIRIVKGISFDSTLSLRPEPKFWSGPVGADGDNKLTYITKDGSMAVEFRAVSENSDEVIAKKKEKDSAKAILTVFRDFRAVSHTFTSGTNQYTVTPSVCVILKHQTGSDSMSELSSKAKTCSDFLKKQLIPASFADAMKDIQSIHDTNVKRLKESSVSKEAIVAPPGPAALSTRDYMADLIATADFRKEKPRPMPKGAVDIFSADAFKDDVSYRAVLADVANVCATFFPDAASVPAAATPPAGNASGAATAK